MTLYIFCFTVLIIPLTERIFLFFYILITLSIVGQLDITFRLLKKFIFETYNNTIRINLNMIIITICYLLALLLLND